MPVIASVTTASEGPDILGRAALALVLAVGGLLITAIGRLGATGRLHRNRVAGIRTRRSLAGDREWLLVHRVAAPWCYASGGALLLGGLAAAVAPDGDLRLRMVLTATCASVLLALLAARSGHRALDRSERKEGKG